MYPNWKFSKIDVNSSWQCDEIQNNCDKCGRLYRYNWRRRRTRDKTCNLCVNEVKCNVVLNIKRERNSEAEVMNYENKPPEENLCLEKRTWDTPLSVFQFPDSPTEPRTLVSDPTKKVFGFQEFTDQLLYEMKTEFGEELRNPQKPLHTDFEWPSTSQLSKVDCLRAFNIMKQILLREMAKCEELSVSDPLVLRRKFYLERRFQSLEREKIRRLKIYESLYIQEEICLPTQMRVPLTWMLGRGGLFDLVENEAVALKVLLFCYFVLASKNFPYSPFPCPFCDRAYTRWGFRRRHIKACHTRTQSLPCKWCLEVLPTHTDWESHVCSKHSLSRNDARNGLLILEEAEVVLQIPQPTRLEALVTMIKEQKNGQSEDRSSAVDV